MSMTKAEQGIALERGATRADLDAAIATFEGACMRGSADGINAASEGAQAALQAHLDAISAQITMTLRQAGFR